MRKTVIPRAGIAADPIRLMLADDEETVLEAMSGIVSTDPTIDIVATARDAVEAIELAQKHAPDVALVDVRMPGGGGAKAAREIRRRSPETNVVALSASTDAKTVMSMLQAGSVGYVGKDQPVDDVLRAIHRSVEGHAAISVVGIGDVAERLAESRVRRSRDPVLVSRDRIERAIDGDLLHIVFQPIVDLSTGRIRGLEALARFHSKPTRSPSTWFAEAETVGLLTPLELTALARALSELHRLPGEIYLSINLSPDTLRSPGLVQSLRETSADQVVLELTEGSHAGDYGEPALCLRPIREMGTRVAIDDVGSGFAGLGHVVGLAPEFVKLDRTLVSNVGADPIRQALIAQLVSFGDEVSIEIAAEGIETARELAAIRTLGVRSGQGFYLGRPGPIPAAREGWFLGWPGRRAAFAS